MGDGHTRRNGQNTSMDRDGQVDGRHVRVDHGGQSGQGGQHVRGAHAKHARRPVGEGTPSMPSRHMDDASIARAASHGRAQRDPEVASHGHAQRDPGAVSHGRAQRDPGTASHGRAQRDPEVAARPARGAKVAVAVAVVLVVLVGAVGGLAAHSLLTIKDQVDSATTTISQLKSDVNSNDYAAAAKDARALADAASQVKAETDGPLWTVAGALPSLSGDVATVRKLVDATNTLCSQALVPAVDALGKYPLDSMITDGTINVANANGLLDTVEQCAPALQTSVDTIRNLPACSNTLVQSYVDKLTGKLDPYLGSFDSYIKLIPVARILVGDGNQSFMLASQNTAETRSMGGFPGAIGTLTMTGGKISVGEFASPHVVLGGVVDSVSADEERVFNPEDQLAYAKNIGINPDFPVVARHWLASYNDVNGTNEVGVISLTPAVLQRILAITGPVTLSNGYELDSTNATAYLTHGIYWQYFTEYDGETANELTDALFSEAAHGAFDKLMSKLNAKTMSKFVDVMVSSIEDNTMMVYSSDAENEQKIVDAGAGGALSSDTSSPTLGVYFNLRASSKLGWYVDMETSVGAATLNADGTSTYPVTTTITNLVTEDELGAATKSSYLLNKDGNLWPLIYLVAPVGGRIEGAAYENTRSDGTPAESSNTVAPVYDTYEGRGLAYLSHPGILPGETLTITYYVTCASPASAGLDVVTTPLLTQYRD